jgi:hypothetical protein
MLLYTGQYHVPQRKILNWYGTPEEVLEEWLINSGMESWIFMSA